jgi:hypothetical protein
VIAWSYNIICETDKFGSSTLCKRYYVVEIPAGDSPGRGAMVVAAKNY